MSFLFQANLAGILDDREASIHAELRNQVSKLEDFYNKMRADSSGCLYF